VKTALLLSGGMDSIALAYWLRPAVAVTINYGQRSAAGEIRAAEAVADTLGIDHCVLRADLSALGSGDMGGAAALAIAPVPEWWPFRNQMLVTLAAMKVLAFGVERLLIGTLKTDDLHADGRREFIEALDMTLRLQEGALRLEAPAIGMTSAELIRISQIPLEILAWAHSCHVTDYACGICRGCRKHYETLVELNAEPY